MKAMGIPRDQEAVEESAQWQQRPPKPRAAQSGLKGKQFVQSITRKPNRKELVAVIQKLQGLIGSAKSAAWNDRDPNRMYHIQKPLEQGFNLCVDALSFDPPHIPK